MRVRRKQTSQRFRPARVGRLLLAGLLCAASASAQPPDIPIVPGLNIVLAVANGTSSEGGPAGVLQGDYEMVVSISGVGADGITHTAFFEGVDAARVERRGSVERVVSAADLKTAAVQIFGFHLADPPRANGTTALGPSLGVTRELAQKGTAAYSFRQWIGRDTISGTLRRTANSPIKFPVLLNGKRVELDAIVATGQMALGTAKRPFEMAILDHPRYPISLRIAYGPRDGGFPFKPDFMREVVRIDFPGPPLIADALDKECRVELKGVYFDFNQATLQPQSGPALKEIADALRKTRRRVTIEGHTDNIGSDRYNDDLSSRRATTVKDALIRDHGIAEATLSTAGFGERRPVESNDSLSGRARNRRVELVCAQAKP
jgi:outer membrane protein OmpA-like peptidoglycan-associated protein